MKKFNKLVRDKIPEIIEKNGEVAKTRILSDEEYLSELTKKLGEETREFQESGEIEELADILEVMYGICRAKHIPFDEIEVLRVKKKAKRGGFAKKIFLESTKEKDE